MKPIITLISFLLLLAATVVTSAASSPALSFIRSSCRATRYPALCLTSLSSYAPTLRANSPRQLAHAALTVSATRARAAAAYVAALPTGSLRSRAAGAVRDCIETMADSVDRLKRSVDEMGRMGRAGSVDFQWHMGNVQTWVSAALTDQNTCLDSLAEGGAAVGSVRGAIRNKVVEVAQVTSNALALVNRIGA